MSWRRGSALFVEIWPLPQKHIADIEIAEPERYQDDPPAFYEPSDVKDVTKKEPGA
jgi:hypothetical protein